MDRLTLFGLFAVTLVLVTYALEDRSRWFVPRPLRSPARWVRFYGFLQGAWPFGLVEAVWAMVALRRWSLRPAAHCIARRCRGVLISFKGPRQRRPRRFPLNHEQTMWRTADLIELFKTEFPILLAPMAGIMDADLAIAAAQGGALGSLPCAMLSVEKAREQVNIIRQRVSAPLT